jgi:hypothetical protein
LPGGGSLAGASASGAELHVRATEPEISAEDQPTSATPQASAGTNELHVPATPQSTAEDAAPQPPTAVPTFKEWKQLYPVQRLDEQKADQVFKALSNADKTKATDGLRSHLGYERWRLTPEYIPFASKFLKERHYDYAPPQGEKLAVRQFHSRGLPNHATSRHSERDDWGSLKTLGE